MKELENKISSVFLPEKQVVVNARETDTADSVRYKYDITFDGQSPRNYIAMQKMPENDDFVEREIIAPAFARVRKRENENSLNFGSSPREDTVRNNGLSEIREEKKENTDYVAPVFKGAIGGAADRAWTAFSSVYHGGMDLGSWIAELKTGDEKNTNIDEEVRRSIVQSMMAKEEVMKFFNLVPDENDSQTGYELGNVLGSVLESFGVAGLTKSSSAMAAYIGLSGGGGSYEELRTGGVQPLESLAVAFGVGFTGGMLERYGFHNLVEAWSVKRLRSAVFKSMAGEFIQEASQTGAEELLMAPYREGYQPEILKEMATAGVYGAIGGLFGFGLGRAMNTRARNYYKSLLQKDYNMSPEKADELVEAAFLDNEQAKTELKELLDNETIATLENDNAVEDAKQVMQEGKNLLDRMLAQRAAGLSDEMQARVDEVEESLRQNALNNGLDEQEAAATANLGASIVRKVAEVVQEEGLDIDETVERAAFSLQNRQNQEKTVDENFQEVRSEEGVYDDYSAAEIAAEEELSPEERQNELDEERIAMMVEDGGMSVEEATFRVKTGREPTELDKALGYDFVPYQIGEALTERENGYKIADDNETVEAVVIPDNALPEFKTRADLRNWLIGKFNEIGNATIKSTGANVEFNKTGAQRAIKNARQKKNNIAYPEIKKVVSGAKYSGFREADERHQNVKGQDVYHSGVVYKGVPYSVEFYVDVPLSGNTGDNFAGNKIREIKIAPTETRVTSENQNRPANNLSDAISNISLAVLRGKVKPARYDAETGVLYQIGGEHRGRGYVGHSMSVNMAQAQANNELPASKAASKLGVGIEAIKNVLSPSAWHHASSYYNRVNVYDINPYLELKAGRKLDEDEYTPEEIAEIEENWEKMKSYPKPEKNVKEYYGDASWIEWTGTRQHPKPVEHHEENVLIREKGSFYTIHRKNGEVVRKKIGSNGTVVVSEEEKAVREAREAIFARANGIRKEIEAALRGEYENYRRAHKLDRPDMETFRSMRVEENWGGDNYYIAGQKPTGKEKTIGLRRIHQESDKYQLQEWDGSKWQVLEEHEGSFARNWDATESDYFWKYADEHGGKLYNRLLSQSEEELTEAIREYEKKTGEETYFQTGKAKDLYATHNMNLAGVKGALKLGGLAMPSLALRKVSQGNINQFGEIVFVANEKLATPSRGTNVYDRDAWTPSIAYQIKYELLPEANDFIKETLSKVGRERDLSMFVYNINYNITSPRSNDMAIELYAIDKGLGENYNQYEIMNSQEYVEWYEDNLMSHAEPYLLTENSTNTDMVRKKLTLDNIMKVLKKQEKESGGFLGNYPDISNILNYFAYKFKDLKEIRKNKHKLVSKEEQVEAVRELNEKFSNLVEQVATANEQSYFDTLSDVAVTIIDRDTKASEKLKSRGLKGPENLDEIVEDIREDIINIPTDYFEVKPRRIVDFSEFSGVIIPKGKKYDEVADILEKEHFLTVERVEENNEQEYNEALNNIYDAASTTFFQTGEKAVGRRVYSVFDLKEGDHTAIGDVQEIDNENRTIKINDRIYSMLLLDTQIQYKGLVVNDAPVGNAEENVSETEQVEKVKKAEENRPVVEEQKRNNREYNQKAKDYFGITNNLDVGGYILTDGDVLDLSGRKFGSDGKSRSIDHREISDAFEDYSVSMEDFINSGNIRYMPESNSILMSDMPTSEQYKVIEKIINRADGEVRVELMNDANNWGSDKDFSREYPVGTTLTKIKRDINAFYRGAGVRDIMQFLQTGRTAEQKSRLLYPVMGQYEPLTKVITLFKGRDKTTFTHEMLHHYLPIYLGLLERGGKWEKLQGLYKELGVSRMADMGREEWEKLVDMGTSYIFYNQAPNEASKSIFEYAKQWMIDAYNTVKRFIKPSKEIEQFFDELLSGEELPDVTSLRGRAAELAKILQGARNGQELTVNGLSLRDISRLRQALYARIPAAGKTLADEIRAAGGIDTESELARQLGYDSRRGTETGFWNYKGAIKDETQLVEFLRDHGYLPETTENTYEETSAVWDKVQRLIDERNNTYTDRERTRQMKRESALAAGEVVSRILDEHYIGDVKKLEEDLRSATKMLAEKGAAAVDKTTLDYLAFAVKQMEENYRRLLYADKEKRYNYQEQLTKFIKDLPLDYNHKSKFMDKIRMVKDERTFNKYLNEIKERTEKYVAQEQRRMLSDLIQAEVKSSRPRKVMAQKYDYENNVLFKDLRDYNKLTQVEAAAQLYALDEQEKARQKSGENSGSRGYLLRRMFLEYKTNGMDSSPELMRQLYDMIGEAKELGRMAKDENEFAKSFEREEERQQVIDKLVASKADKNKPLTQITNIYRRGVSNLYSMLNSIAGKDVAEKYEMETVMNHWETETNKHLKKTNAKAEAIYGVKSYGDLLNLMADKGKVVGVLYGRQKNDQTAESYDENLKYDVSILDIIDIYNAIKNQKTKADYENAYGADQINRLISLLSPEDMKFGDMLMEDVNSRFPELNRVYVATYGMDLKKVDNYWMGSAEHLEPVDIVNDFRQQATTPGFFKERTTSTITPVAKNAWIKYQKHISQSYYMTEVAEKYKRLADLMKSKRIKNLIQNRYGEGVYNTLIKQIENIGLNAQSPRLDDVSGLFQRLLNNWVGAKVALNPVVFVGQMTSFTNYAEGVKTADFLKNFAYALRHPIEAKDFMMKHNGDFLRNRYESGFSEAMTAFMNDARDAAGAKFGLSPKAKFNLTNALSFLVRQGDLASLIYGGYGQFKSMLDSGMSVEEAKRKYEFYTLRSQQSGNAASISDWQQQRGFARLYLAFKNTSMQYTRKIADTIIMLNNGDISRTEGAKILTNYLLVQPALWVIAKNIFKSLIGLADDDDEFDDGVLEQLLVNPIEGVPLVGDMVRYAYREAAGERNYSLFSTPLLDDVERSFRKAYKEEKDVYDYADVIIPFIEMLTSVPVATAKRYIKRIDESDGE